jgi:uncharacterized protein
MPPPAARLMMNALPDSPVPRHLTPTDLANHLACAHLTQLERARREGRLDLRVPRDPRLEALVLRGLEHEKRYIEQLRAEGRTVRDLSEEHDAKATLAAMREGFGAIVQAPLAGDGWRGRADILLRVEERSALGAHSYEPADTKLAHETRAATILQLCTYCELMAGSLGAPPRGFVVVSPLAATRWRTADFAAYFRLVRARLSAAATALPAPATYPDPVPHCDICRYWMHCDRRRRDDDHLSLVAGIRAQHARELQRQGLTTLALLAACRGELPAPPERGDAATFRRLGVQAALQLRAREEPVPPCEPLPAAQGRGLARLPEPSEGDVFLDFEGDPFVAGGGREYLTGWAWREGGTWHYRQAWAWDADAERLALEAFVDFAHARWLRHEGMHVYHYGAYEAAALRRLVARHGTRGVELDALLRGRRLVDLLAVVREGLRIGVESYGLKELEPVTGFSRGQELRAAAAARREVELALELGLARELAPDLLETVAAYNREDCRSAAELRAWLEARRAAGIAAGSDLPRPAPADETPSEAVQERDGRIGAAEEALLAGRARRARGARRRAASPRAARADARLLPPRGEVRVVGALPPARARPGVAARRARRDRAARAGRRDGLPAPLSLPAAGDRGSRSGTRCGSRRTTTPSTGASARSLRSTSRPAPSRSTR